MEDDGDNPTRVSTESAAARRPSYSQDGTKMFYDVDGDIWVRNTGGSPSPTNLTADLEECDGTQVCEDVDAGPRFDEGEDYLVVFTRETTADTTGDIYIATFDASEGELVDLEAITSGTGLINYHPAWCGDAHVIWSREIPNDCEPHCELGELYYWELCIQQVNENGAIPNTLTCYLGESHERANQHPSCNSDGTMAAFAQSLGDTKAGTIFIEQPHEICTIDLEDEEPESTLDCLVDEENDPNNELDDTNPAWSPGNSQLAFASEREGQDETSEYDIWAVNAQNLPQQTPVNLTDTDDDILDLDPDWGPASLP
jgi:Tol biopolymer transport system component